MHFSTKAIHAGKEARWQQSAVMPPIYMTSTFTQEAPGEGAEYEYTRASNPNFTILEKTLAALEGGRFATVFSSGLGALTALLSCLRSGDGIVVLDGVYGGTYRLLTQVFTHLGIRLLSVPPGNAATLKQALTQDAKLLCFETPSNPRLDIHDIAAMAADAHAAGVACVVDNTFATPYNQTPLAFGADLVWHSTTKYIGGHSDTIGGAIVTDDPVWKEKLDFARKAVGTNPSPFDCWLITRGVKTLALRMQQHAFNAQRLAEYLHGHPTVRSVYYPGLPSHPSYTLAKEQMRTPGGMVSVDFNLPVADVKRLVSQLQYFMLAESLGGVESLICHPATMTHTSLPPEEQRRLGITDTFVRMSVGIEDSDDLLNDLRRILG